LGNTPETPAAQFPYRPHPAGLAQAAKMAAVRAVSQAADLLPKERKDA